MKELSPPIGAAWPLDEAFEAEEAWARLRPVELDPRRLARSRVVTHDKSDAAHIHYDMLRTRLLQTLKDREWRSIAVTSPSPGCGKTLTCLNLAFSFARQTGCRTLLLELDLRRPRMAELLGVRPSRCVSSLLSGEANAQETLLRWGRGLAFGLAKGSIPDATELIQDDASVESLSRALAALAPTVVLIDLPPLLATDDAAAFLRRADGALLVAAAGKTELGEIDRCAREISQATTDLGVVLNRSEFTPKSYGGYWGYPVGKKR